MALIERFDRSGDPDDLQEGLDAARQAVRATPDAGPAQAVHLYNLGVALWEHVGAGPGAASLSSAVDCFRAAARTGTAVPLLRVRAAEGWANLSARHGDWREASAGWDQVFDLLPVLVDDALGRPDRQHHLSLVSGAGPDAAAVELALGRPRRAWQRLEQGRGVLLGQALQARADEARLAVDHPDLATRRARLRDVLDLGSAGPQAPEGRAGSVEDRTRLLATIRDAPGYERFGALPSAVELSELPVAGPVVALTVSTWRCSALVLRRDGSGPAEVHELPLPDLRYDDAVAHANTVLAAVHTPGRPLKAQMNPVLVWLWDVAVRPVLDHLGHRRPPGTGAPWPRVWWMPTGPLCLLPVHAAGHHDDPDDPRSVVNRVVSSYTPTLRTLRESGTSGERVGPSVVVGTDGPPDDAALTYAQKEARRVAACIGPSPALLLGPAATRRAVTELLPGAARVHLACHAVAEEDPSVSRLVLADGSLRAGDVSAADLRAGDIVYLSTCTSAYGGTVLPDESLHMASAFQLAGFRHAVATLWPINDVVAPRVAERFYRRLAAGAGPALALHDAVRAVRRGRPPVLWASHIHSGP